MTQPPTDVFAQLFSDAYAKCFGKALEQPLSEPESRHFSNEIEEKTGLTIGWKSLKNYAAQLLAAQPGRAPNPSSPTLDTLARYVLDAPPTTEALRKRNEAHLPWWFRYREEVGSLPSDSPHSTPPKQVRVEGKRGNRGVFIAAALLALLAVAYLLFSKKEPEKVADDFRLTTHEAMRDNGWFVLAKDPDHWGRRGEKPGQLSLFTLEGDNWQDGGNLPRIRNLLTRPVGSECFSTEVHFADFIPKENWQQAGLILMEDTSFTGKSVRISIAYNDFLGGFAKHPEIIVQVVSSLGKAYKNVEEITHQALFSLEKDSIGSIVEENMRHSAVRVERQGRSFRFLYAASPFDNFSFKELASHDFDMTPRYVGIFALKGFVDTAAMMPVRVRFFRLEGVGCD